MQEFSLKYNRPLMYAIQSVSKDSTATILSVWHDIVINLIKDFDEKWIKNNKVSKSSSYTKASFMYPNTDIKCLIRVFAETDHNLMVTGFNADVKMPNTTKRIHSKQIRLILEEEDLLGVNSENIRLQIANTSGKRILSQLGFGEENEETT